MELTENANNSDFNVLCSTILSLLNEVVPPELPTTLRFSFENENGLKQILISLGSYRYRPLELFGTNMMLIYRIYRCE